MILVYKLFFYITGQTLDHYPSFSAVTTGVRYFRLAQLGNYPKG